MYADLTADLTASSHSASTLPSWPGNATGKLVRARMRRMRRERFFS